MAASRATCSRISAKNTASAVTAPVVKALQCGPCPRPGVPPAYNPPLEQLRGLVEREERALATPRQRTRFLCGISSPATTKAKLQAHPLFGALEGVPFQEVLDMVKECD